MVFVFRNGYTQSLAADLWKQAKDCKGTDTALQYGGSEFSAHSCVVNFAAPEFLEIWNSDMHLPDYDNPIGEEAFEAILEFFYTGEIDVPDQQLDQVVAFAKKYRIHTLLEAVWAGGKKQQEKREDLLEMLKTASHPVENQQREVLVKTKTQPPKEDPDYMEIQDSVTIVVESLNKKKAEKKKPFGPSLVSSLPENRGANLLSNEVRPHLTSYPSSSSGESSDDLYCCFCQEQCQDEEMLAEHEDQHGCDTCNQVFESVSARAAHLCTVRHGRRLYTCSKCGKVYMTKLPFINHRKIHDKSTFKCQYCIRTFVHDIWRRKHELTHIRGEGTYECRVCSEKFCLKIKLFSHYIKSEHLLHEVPYKCKFCGKYFSNKRDMESHCRVHKSELLFQCGVCDKSFHSKVGLKHHIDAIHLKTKHGCEVCGKLFSQKSHLKDHRQTHIKKKRYVCSFCGFAASSKINLRRHEGSHTGVYDLYCDICSKGFVTKYDLRRHVSTMHLRRR